MAFPGLTINVKCRECGTDFPIDVEGTEPEKLPSTETLTKIVSYVCPSCGSAGEATMSLTLTDAPRA
jgi:DNA-directed RNA polymerase subunit RPC12/RpoP